VDFDHAAHTKFALDPLHAALDCSSCHADARFRSAGTRCADCHADAAGLLAGRFEAVTGEPDPHASLACADCHGTTAAANRPAALARRCTECHTPEYAGLLATWNSRLGTLASASELDPVLAERLRRSGVHNFLLARDRLRPPAPR
jgi:Zn finger protein HypA/HybF involved in hydrogenase expression